MLLLKVFYYCARTAHEVWIGVAVLMVSDGCSSLGLGWGCEVGLHHIRLCEATITYTISVAQSYPRYPQTLTKPPSQQQQQAQPKPD